MQPEIFQSNEHLKKNENQLDGRFAYLPVEKLFPGRNIRGERSFAATELLNHSIAEVGILEPLLVFPIDQECYEIVSGFGRYAAAKACNLKTVPCRIFDRDLSLQKNQQLQLHENWVREDLSPLVVATVLSETMKAEKLKQCELGKRFAIPQPRVSELLKLLKLSPSDKARVAAGELSVKAANQLVKDRKRSTKSSTKKPITSPVIRVDGHVFALDQGLRQIFGDILVLVARAKDANRPLTDRDVKKAFKEFRLPSDVESAPAPAEVPELAEASNESC